MNKMFLVLQREFLSRVKKKSFVLATILVPLAFPVMIGGMVYLAIQNKKNKEQEIVRVLDESALFTFEDDRNYSFEIVDGSLDSAKVKFQSSTDFALLYIPEIGIDKPEGLTFYTKSSPGINVVDGFQGRIWSQIRERKLIRSGLFQAQLDSLETDVYIDSINLNEKGKETRSSGGSTFALAYVMGFLIYIFLFVYGAQVMQGVIEEKNSKVIEVIVSTISPFQMMLGKVLGVAAVGIVQFVIWIVLMTVLSSVSLAVFGLSLDPAQIQEVVASGEATDIQSNPKIQNMLAMISDIPIMKIAGFFVFYFLGGYLLYGALFGAVGSAVDTPADAQQFMFPIMIPIIGALMGLMFFVMDDPDSTISFWLSIIPFTSPIVMMGRIGFGIPAWEIVLSMVMLVGGFIFTLWVAGRIYRVGILMHGTKVNYKTLVRWFLQK